MATILCLRTTTHERPDILYPHSGRDIDLCGGVGVVEMTPAEQEIYDERYAIVIVETRDERLARKLAKEAVEKRRNK